MTDRPKLGRPREAYDGGLRRWRKVRMTDAEWAEVKRLARRCGLTASEWVRRKALAG